VFVWYASDNLVSGDRSKNTAQISITTPNNELEANVSPEQLHNAALYIKQIISLKIGRLSLLTRRGLFVI
jgi:hypothetical protein